MTLAAAPPPPRLADGVELIGQFADSGFKEPPYIARRPDGQVVQLAPMLYALAEEIDGERSLEEVAAAFSERIQRGVDAGMVAELLDTQLRRLGIVANADGRTGKVAKRDPLLALKLRQKVLPARVVRSLTSVFRHLFLPPVLIAALVAFAALDVWLFGVHGISQSLRHVLYQPGLLVLLVAGVVVATAFHEIGHASAVRYGGAEPGVMGVGIYIVWPAFYTDITDAYRLGRWGRVRADCGGMYFNVLFALAVAAVYAVTGFEPLLLLVVLQNFTILQQSLPFVRLDGYYIVSDLTGVPDMFSRIGPVLRSVRPGRRQDPRVAELRPRAKRVVIAYVLTVVPLLVLVFALMLVHAPRAFATAYDSAKLHYEQAGPAFSDGDPLGGVLAVVQMLVLILPSVGFVYTVVRTGRVAAPAAWSWSAHEPWRRPALLGATAAGAALLAYLWWPHADSYRPIQPGERGTIVSGVKDLRNVPRGQGPLTPERVQQLKGAPLRSEEYARREAARRGEDGPSNENSPGGYHRTKDPSKTRTTPAPHSTTPTTSTPAATTPAPEGTTSTEAPPAAPTETAPPASTTTQPATTPAQTTPTTTSTTPSSTTTTP